MARQENSHAFKNEASLNPQLYVQLQDFLALCVATQICVREPAST